jgi:hypothetical protein
VCQGVIVSMFLGIRGHIVFEVILNGGLYVWVHNMLMSECIKGHQA